MRRTAGFTLIEVMAALAILGTALFVLLDAHYAALRMNTMMSEEVSMRQFVESVASWAEVEVSAGNLAGAGDFGKRNPDYTWEFSATQESDDESVLLYSVEAKVTGPSEERLLKFYVYDCGALDDTDKKGMGDKKSDKSKSKRSTGNSRNKDQGTENSGTNTRGGRGNSRSNSRSRGDIFSDSGGSW